MVTCKVKLLKQKDMTLASDISMGNIGNKRMRNRLKLDSWNFIVSHRKLKLKNAIDLPVR